MRVLLLSQWYTPEPVAKPHQMAQGLLNRGHQVIVITGFPNYPHGYIYPGYHLSWRQWEKHDGAQVLRLPLYPNHSHSGVKRAFNFLSFASSVSLLGPLLSGSADIIWVYDSLITGVSAWWLGLLRRVPFIYEVQDLWPETLRATGMLSSERVIHRIGQLAGFVYTRAAAITVISPGFKRNLIAKGVPADKIHVIPNWADEHVYRPVPRDETVGVEHNLTGRFNVIYGGNLGAAQAMDNVLAAAALLRDLPEVQFVLIGDGVDEAKLRRQAQERGLGNVRFLGRQPTTAMPGFFAWADALLVHLKRDPLFEITIPSKTLAYLACGRPILCCVAGDAAEVVETAGAGLICPPENPEALAQTVRELYAMSPEQRAVMGEAGRRAFLANYTRTVLLDRYEELFIAVAGQRGMKNPALEKRGNISS